MTGEGREQPTEADAAEVVRRVLGIGPESIRRFMTGLAHCVYDVQMPDGSGIVVRLGTPDQDSDFQGALHWSKTLRPLAVPLPALLAHGDYRGKPYLVLERLDGDDLGQVYRALKSPARRSIAEEICQIQRIVAGLPEGPGYGFIRVPGDPSRKSWGDVIEGSLARSHTRMFTVALTRTALLATGDDTEYTDHWCNLLDLTQEEHDAVRFYTALFCVDFMSEFGHRFNHDVQQLDRERLTHLEKILNESLDDIE